MLNLWGLSRRSLDADEAGVLGGLLGLPGLPVGEGLLDLGRDELHTGVDRQLHRGRDDGGGDQLRDLVGGEERVVLLGLEGLGDFGGLGGLEGVFHDNNLSVGEWFSL